MPIPFGVSVGDVIAVGALLRKTYSALKRHGGAASEYQATAKELDRLEAILKFVETIRLPAQIDDSNISTLLKALYGQASACLKIIEEFAKEVEKFEQAHHKLQAIWAATKWANSFSDKLPGIRLVIAAHVDMIQLLCQYLQISLSAHRNKKQDVFNHEVRNLLDSLGVQVSDGFLALQNQIDDDRNTLLSLSSISSQIARDVSGAEINTSLLPIIATRTSDHGLALARIESNLSLIPPFHGNLIHTTQTMRQQLDQQAALLNTQNRLLEELSCKFGKLNITSNNDMQIEQHQALNPGLENLRIEDFAQIATQQFYHALQGLFNLAMDLITNNLDALESSSVSALAAITRSSHLVRSYLQAVFPLLLQLVVYIKFFGPRMALLVHSMSVRPPPSLNIIFEDVLGRPYTLPFHYFREWKRFKALLEAEFQDGAGREEVQKGDYKLLNKRSYDVELSESNWEATVSPDTVVVMSVLLHRLRHSDDRCIKPECGGQLFQDRPRRRICTRCGLEVVDPMAPSKVVEIEEEHHLTQNSSLSYSNQTGEQTGSGTLSGPNFDDPAEKRSNGSQSNILSFRRVHTLLQSDSLSHLESIRNPVRHIHTQDLQTDAEPLSSNFRRLRPEDISKFFIPGRVFSILWTGPTSSVPVDAPMSDAFSIVRYNETAYTERRRFIVIKNFNFHSICVPIATYRRYGTLNRPDAEYHSMAFSGIAPPDPLPGEILTKYPIKIVIRTGESLEFQSRINFSKIYTVEHNVKVNYIGNVDKEYLQHVLAYARESSGV